jgi:hypothetical protein
LEKRRTDRAKKGQPAPASLWIPYGTAVGNSEIADSSENQRKNSMRKENGKRKNISLE